ncbi:unnamed protein product [Trichobilharzia szidati]|nr:unnamed protein product [Trichobilharzia szidati]
MVEIFHHPEEKVFKTTFISKTSLFYLITSFILFVGPVIILSYLKNIWPFYKYIPVNIGPCIPEINHAFIWIPTVDQYNQVDFKMWSGSDNVLNTVRSNMLPGSFNYFTHESFIPFPARDAGKSVPKAIEISVTLNNIVNFSVMGARLFIPITCSLKISSRWKDTFALNLTGLVWNEYLSMTPINNLFIQSELVIKQTQALRLHGIDPIERANYRRTLVSANIIRYNTITYELDNIMYDIMDRNLTIHLGKVRHLASMDKTNSPGSFSIDLMIHLSEKEILFETAFINKIKWVYIFYIGIWIIFLWPISWLKRVVFEKRLISDNIMEFVKPPPNVHLNKNINEW